MFILKYDFNLGEYDDSTSISDCIAEFADAKASTYAECKYISDYIHSHLEEYLTEYFADNFEGLSDKDIEMLVSNANASDCIWQLDYQAQEFIEFEDEEEEEK